MHVALPVHIYLDRLHRSRVGLSTGTIGLSSSTVEASIVQCSTNGTARPPVQQGCWPVYVGLLACAAGLMASAAGLMADLISQLN